MATRRSGIALAALILVLAIVAVFQARREPEPSYQGRLLSEWQRRGAVAKSRGRVVLRRPERLILS